MTNIRRLVPISLSLALLCGSFVQAEEISDPAMTDSSAPEVTTENSNVVDPGLALGRKLRIARRDCAPLRRESVEKWNACRKENIDMRFDVLKMRREIRQESTQNVEEVADPAMTESSAPEVMEETAPTMVDMPSRMENSGAFDPGLALGRKLRIARRDCAPLRRESVEKWNACRKENIDMRSDVLKMRHEIRENSTQEFVKERAEGSQKRVKPLRENFVEFNKNFRNYYIEPTPAYDLLRERVKTRRQNWQELRQKAGDVDARSRMLERKAQSMGSDNEDLEE